MTGVAPLPLASIMLLWDEAVAVWRLDHEERSLLLGPVGAGPVDEIGTYAVLEAEARLRLLVELARLTRGRCDDGATWLRRPREALGNASPLALMAQSSEWIRWFIAGMDATL